MGRHKLLMPWGEATLIEQVLSAWMASHVDRAVVVVRPSDTRLREICGRVGAEVAVPHSDPAEMKHSVQVGLAHVERRFGPHPQDVWLLAPADMPGLSCDVINRLLDAHSVARPSIVAPALKGHRGHPVLFPWPLAAEVHALEETESIKTVVQRHSVEAISWHDPAILDDIDTPSDYRRLQL
jgi:molybdenum cofactor cytidylyltransferase